LDEGDAAKRRRRDVSGAMQTLQSAADIAVLCDESEGGGSCLPFGARAVCRGEVSEGRR
jgi:hypothetical protein